MRLLYDKSPKPNINLIYKPIYSFTDSTGFNNATTPISEVGSQKKQTLGTSMELQMDSGVIIASGRGNGCIRIKS
jgi:hypothetical protein